MVAKRRRLTIWRRERDHFITKNEYSIFDKLDAEYFFG